MSTLANVLITVLGLWAALTLLICAVSFLGWLDAYRDRDRRAFARQFRRAWMWPYDACRVVLRTLREILAQGRESD